MVQWCHLLLIQLLTQRNCVLVVIVAAALATLWTFVVVILGKCISFLVGGKRDYSVIELKACLDLLILNQIN